MFSFYKLKNGVSVMLVPMQDVQSVSLGLYLRTGTRDETKEENGLAHFLEHVVFKGSKNYPTPESLMVLEATGGYKNAGTAQEYTVFEAKLPSDKLDLGLSVLSDIILNPLLKSEELENEKKTILEEISRRNDQSEELVVENFYTMRYKNALTTLGTEESVKSLHRDQFVSFWQKNYTSANLLVCIAGKFDKPDLEKYFEQLPISERVSWPKPEILQGPMINVVERPSDQQVQMTLGGEAFAMDDTRRFALNVLFRILDFGLSGRLFKATRIDRNLVYNIHAGVDLNVDHGSWLVTAGVSKQNLSELIAIILKELRITEVELTDAKEKVRVPLLFSLESPMSQMEFYAAQGLFRPQEILTHAQVVEKIMAVTAKDVQEVAQALFQTQNLYLSLVGPVKEGEVRDTILEI
jgi:predicted Zn-dependent peptidase